jgi:hypothetical protein
MCLVEGSALEGGRVAAGKVIIQHLISRKLFPLVQLLKNPAILILRVNEGRFPILMDQLI